MNTKLNLKPNNVKEIEITIEKDRMQKEFDTAATHFKPQVTVQGFRKGTAPLNLVKAKIEPEKLNNKVVEQLSKEMVQTSIDEHKIKPIASPKLKINKISEEGFEATLTFVERPNIKLADYKKLTKEAFKAVSNDQTESSKSEVKDPKSKTETGKEKTKEQIEQEEHEKIHEFEHKLVDKIYDLLIEKSEMELAQELIDDETDRLITSFLKYIARLGIKFEDYVKQTGADITKIQEDYKIQAKKNLQVEFILSEVVKKEDIKVTDAEIEDAINNTPDENYQKELRKEANKYYIESQLLKQKAVRKLLELSGFDHVH